MSSDLSLWKELKSGSKAALQKIYDQEFWFLYHYGLKISSKSSLVEDCIQDLFIELWESRERLSDTDSIRRYVLVSLRRKIIRKINQSRKTQLEENPSDDFFDAELDIEKILIAKEQNQEQISKLKEAFESLSNKQKEVIYLKFYSGLDYEDISAAMGINYQSARNLVHRALKVLKKNMHVIFIFLLMI